MCKFNTSAPRDGVVQMFLVTSVRSSACLSGHVSRVNAGHSSLNLTKPVRATDTSRFLQQTPWLPCMQLVVGRLEHLFYVTYQLKNMARYFSNSWAKAGEVNQIWRTVRVLLPSSFVFPQWSNMQALCEGVIRHILYRKTDTAGYRKGCVVISSLSLTSYRITWKL